MVSTTPSDHSRHRSMPAAPHVPLGIPTRHVVGGRSLRVWLPQRTEAVARRRHPVLYLLDGQNVVPQAALALGYQFVHPDLPGALRDLAGTRAKTEAR